MKFVKLLFLLSAFFHFSCQPEPQRFQISLDEIPRTTNSGGVAFGYFPISWTIADQEKILATEIPFQFLNKVKELQSIGTPVHHQADELFKWVDSREVSAKERLFLECFAATILTNNLLEEPSILSGDEKLRLKTYFELLMKHTPQDIDRLFPALVILETEYDVADVKAYGEAILKGVEVQQQKNAEAELALGQIVGRKQVESITAASQQAGQASLAADEHLVVEERQTAMLKKWLSL